MSEILFDHTISAIITHDFSSRATTAEFKRYGIDREDVQNTKVTDDVSVEFDTKIPLTPWAVQWTESERIGNETTIDNLFGERFTVAMLHAREVGASAVRFSLSLDNRIALAHLQHEDPSTPTALRQIALYQLGELEAVRDQQEAEMSLILGSFTLPPFDGNREIA